MKKLLLFVLLVSAGAFLTHAQPTEFDNSSSGAYVKKIFSGQQPSKVLKTIEEPTLERLDSHFWTLRRVKNPVGKLLLAANNGVYFLFSREQMDRETVRKFLSVDLTKIELAENERKIIDGLGQNGGFDTTVMDTTFLGYKKFDELSKSDAFRFALYTQMIQLACENDNHWYKRRIHYDPVSEGTASSASKQKKSEEIGAKVKKCLLENFCSQDRYVVIYNGLEVSTYPHITHVAKVRLTNLLRELVTQEELEAPNTNYVRFSISMKGRDSFQNKEVDLQDIHESTDSQR